MQWICNYNHCSVATGTLCNTNAQCPSGQTCVNHVQLTGTNQIIGNAITAIETGNQTTTTVTNLFGGTTNYFFVVAVDTRQVPSPPSQVVLNFFSSWKNVASASLTFMFSSGKRVR